MKLFIDKSRATFTVTKATEPKTDADGRQRADKRTGELLFVVQVMALDETGGEMLTITVAGQPPKVNVGQIIDPVELEAIPWAQNGRNGVAYRAKDLKSVSAAKAA
ncbi:hypothetical protein ABN028_09545 [Actinopolymorpha sp. B17G11]|uniref:hypothetical protein n=1 Tax=Actinopolymorpha sp. B17G11 TaxID=3160861 RepID=UPI0032E3B1D0